MMPLPWQMPMPRGPRQPNTAIVILLIRPGQTDSTLLSHIHYATISFNMHLAWYGNFRSAFTDRRATYIDGA